MSSNSDGQFDDAWQRLRQSSAQTAASLNVLRMEARKFSDRLAQGLDAVMMQSDKGQAALKDAQQVIDRAAAKRTP